MGLNISKTFNFYQPVKKQSDYDSYFIIIIINSECVV